MSEQIKFKLVIDGKESVVEMDAALLRLGQTGTTAVSSVSKDWNSMIVTWNQGLDLIGKISRAMSVMFQPVAIAGQFEQYEVALKNLLGSTDAAKARLEELKRFAETTPFELPQVVQAANQLQALGRYSDETLRLLGDLASASGKPFEQAISAFAKLATGQKGIAIDMFRDLLITTNDWSKATQRKIGKNGELQASFEEMIQALPKIMREKGFSGMMDEQSKTLNGMTSNLQDNITKLKNSIGEQFLPLVKSALSAVNELLKETNAGLVDFFFSAKKGEEFNRVMRKGPEEALPILLEWKKQFGDVKMLNQGIEDQLEKLKAMPGLGVWKKSFDDLALAAETALGRVKKTTTETTTTTTVTAGEARDAKTVLKEYIEKLKEVIYLEKLRHPKKVELPPVPVDQEAEREKKAADARLEIFKAEKEAEQRIAQASYTKTVQDGQTALEDQKQMTDQFGNFTANTIESAFMQATERGRMNWRAFLNDLVRMLAASALKQMILSIFNIGTGGTAGGIGGFLGKLFGSARGTVVDEPMVTLVGEEGPEIIAPVPDFNTFVKDIVKAVRQPPSSIYQGIADRARANQGAYAQVVNVIDRTALAPSPVSNDSVVMAIKKMSIDMKHAIENNRPMFEGDFNDETLIRRQSDRKYQDKARTL